MYQYVSLHVFNIQPPLPFRAPSLRAGVTDTGDQVAEELAHSMPVFELVVDDGCAVPAGSAVVTCAKPSERKAVVIRAEAASSTACARRCEFQARMSAAEGLIMLGGENPKALDEPSSGKGASETVHVMGMAGSDTAHALGGDFGGGDSRELGTGDFDQVVGFKADRVANSELVESAKTKLLPTVEVRSKLGTSADTAKIPQREKLRKPP